MEMTDITITQEITIELDGKSPFEYVVMKQGDKDSRILAVSLLQNKQPYEIPTGCTARIKYYKPDGKPVLNDCEILEDKILVTYTKQMLAESGVGKGEIVLLKDEKELKSATYYTKIVETVYKTEGLVSDKEFLSMAVVLNDMDQATQKAAANAKIAEQAAERTNEAINNIPKHVDEYLEAHPAEIDPTLTDEKKAAPADKVGEISKDLNQFKKLIKGNNLFTGFQTLTIDGIQRKATNFIDIADKNSIKFVTNLKNFVSFLTLDKDNNVLQKLNTTDSGIVNIEKIHNAAKFCFADNGKLNNTKNIEWIIASDNREDYVPDTYVLNNDLIKEVNGEKITPNSIGISKLEKTLVEFHKTNNLYDDDSRVESMMINGSNVNGLTNWIPYKKGMTIVSNRNYTQYYYFDTEKQYKSKETHIKYPVTITFNSDGYLLVGNTEKGGNNKIIEGTDLSFYYDSYYTFNSDMIPQADSVKSRWNGKKWLAIGDSITDASVADKGYTYWVSKKLNMTCVNVGTSGKAMSYFHDKISSYADDFDLITVLLGTNNQGYNCAIGELNDTYYNSGDYTSNNSFYAQTQRLIDLLIEKYPNSTILFFTPIKRTGTNGTSNNDDGYQINALGLTTEPYADAIKKITDYYGIACLDLYHGGINPRQLWMRQKYFKQADGSDGTHPNNDGHRKYIAPVVEDFINKHAPFKREE